MWNNPSAGRQTAQPLAQGAPTGDDRTAMSPPSISLPKGGGAIRGIGEKFATNPITGTASLTVPITTSPSRSGFGPQLSLSYDSGSGNGPFGLGWRLSHPSITRKTDKGLPQYNDAEESDTFILSDAEDLVPVLKFVNGHWKSDIVPPDVDTNNYTVYRYRPRIEGLFTRIERWTRQKDGDTDTHWRSISKDNITTLYGKTSESRIVDPNDPSRVFSWLICESYDDKGNAIYYEYKAENMQKIELWLAHERNRARQSPSANLYLKRIKYGNETPRQPDEDLSSRKDWLFEVVFDYGEHYTEDDQGQPTDVLTKDNQIEWACRADPFSSYRSGFEVRTYRRCERVLMFHHFPDELGVKDCLVRATHFLYRESPIASFMDNVVQSGYVRRSNGTYLKKSLPALEFEYSEAIINQEVKEVDRSSLENLPVGLEGGRYQWVDLDGEGALGILMEQAGAWFYKRNLSPITVKTENGEGNLGARFGPLEIVGSIPSSASLANGRQQFLDLAGDGTIDLVELERPLAGFYERADSHGWEQFVPFVSWPNIDWNDPNLRFVDLTGDGHADVLITEDKTLTWYPSLTEKGFGSAKKVYRALDEEQGPRLVFADGTQSIYLADMSGDGLTDLVRIRNGDVCYWPNLGYGRFGAKVSMDNAPWFDTPDLFSQSRIRLGDIDGSGVTDIIYLGHDGIDLYFNQSGNSWSEAQTLTYVPATDNLSSVTAVDLLGNGTACLVWSSPLPGDMRRPMRYIDLMGGQKPHLMVGVRNNLGAETRVQYTPATKFYLEDKQDGRPWITRLPFPVHVVDRVETYDRVSRNRLVTRYAYHHGYFDGEEREFRGFGMVEQWDTEEFAVLNSSDTFPSADNVEAASHVPPVWTKTWFHTGAFIDDERISLQYKDEYYYEPALTPEQRAAMLLEDTVLPRDLNGGEEREARRALKGSLLRQEIYALDASPQQELPYRVSERNYTVEHLQPQEDNRHAVFFSHACETIDYHYERQLIPLDPLDPNSPKVLDPRVSHQMTLKVDAFGNVERSVAIAYPRREAPNRLDEQAETHITLTVSRFANYDNQLQWYRVGLPVETQTFEIAKPPEPAVTTAFGTPFSFETIRKLTESLLPLDRTAPDTTKTLPYNDWDWRKNASPLTEPRLRLIEHVCTLYRKGDLTGPCPLGQTDSMALPYEIYHLAFTPELLQDVYDGRVTNEMLQNDGRYVHFAGDTNRWVPSGKIFYSRDPLDPADELKFAQEHFFLPHRFEDPFDGVTRLAYDKYRLIPQETVDSVGNVVTLATKDDQRRDIIALDYRVLQPWLVTDPNQNRSAVAFDALSMVVGTAVMGKVTESKGDALTNIRPDLEQAEIDAFYTDPKGLGAEQLLGTATTRIIYDVARYERLDAPDQPVYAATLARETHASNPLPPGGLKIQVSFSYSDGFGREIQKKIQAEPGPLVKGGPDVAPRWVGGGWTIFNNKGKPVRQYEPFFSATHHFDFAKKVGVSPILFYDPLQRVVATLHPNHTYEKVVFDPWHQSTWDVNDTLHPTQAYDPRTPAMLPDHTFDPVNDPDVGAYFARLPSETYLPTWFDRRLDPAKALEQWPDVDPVNGGPLSEHAAIRASETLAAQRAARHASTASTAHLDGLGRPYLTVADNGLASDGSAQLYRTRVELDIEGNQRTVIDAKGRAIMQYDYDMLGNRVRQASVDAGTRWLLNDVAGKLLYSWDRKKHRVRRQYDALRRQTHLFVSQNNRPEELVVRTVFGEQHPDSNPPNWGVPAPCYLNLRGRVFMQFDGAGIVINVARNSQTGRDEGYDFKGNALHSTRRLAHEYKRQLDWATVELLLKEAPPAVLNLAAIENTFVSLLETDSFITTRSYDALNRPITLTAPDGSEIRPTYNEANLLEQIYVRLPNNTNKLFVRGVSHNARGQRERIDYGNNVSTNHTYDPLTFRLQTATSQRTGGNHPLQDVRYTYDPVGNITQIHDAAFHTVFNHNQRIDPINRYTYDPIYHLIEASGREHRGATSCHYQERDKKHTEFVALTAQPVNNGQDLQNYIEQYGYDNVGNLEHIQHTANAGGWTLTQTYATDSNRISRSDVGCRYEHVIPHDENGNIIELHHLSELTWDHADQLSTAKRRSSSAGTPDMVYFRYDAAGMRIRKVEEQNGKRFERIYVGGFETYREHSGVGQPFERRALHVMDDHQRIALVETDNIDGTRARYQLDNHLGSSLLELDEQGKNISYEEYYPHGGTAYLAGEHETSAKRKRYRYNGKERDDETGLYYYGARYYAPWLGRWINCDPAELADGTNLFVYVRNNPIRQMDTDGRQSTDPQSWRFDPETAVVVINGEERPWREAFPGLAEPPGAPATSASTGRLFRPKPVTGDPLEGAMDTAVWNFLAKSAVGAFSLISGQALLSLSGPESGEQARENIRAMEEAVSIEYMTPEARQVGQAFEQALEIGSLVAGAWSGLRSLGTRLLPRLTVREAASAGAAPTFPRTSVDNPAPRMFSPGELEGVERASPELLEAMRRHGRTVEIAQPGSEEMRFLDYFQAEANVGGETMTHILVRPNPSKAGVLEEYLHGTQHRLGVIERLGPQGAEVHVKDFMIRHQRLLGLSAEDAQRLMILRGREREILGHQLGR